MCGRWDRVGAPPAFAVRARCPGSGPDKSGRRSAWRGSPVALLAPLPALPPPAPRRPKLVRTARFRPIPEASEWTRSHSVGSRPSLPHTYGSLPHRAPRTPKMSGDRRFILNTNAPIHGISDTGGFRSTIQRGSPPRAWARLSYSSPVAIGRRAPHSRIRLQSASRASIQWRGRVPHAPWRGFNQPVVRDPGRGAG